MFVPRSIRIIFLFSILISFSLCAEITLKYQGREYKFNTISENGVEYMKFSDFLSPAKIKPIYNRSIHKISFNTAKNTFILSPISNGIYAGGEVKILDNPLIVKKGVFYISRPAVSHMAPFLSYEFVKIIVFI
ncbi:MAG: hypothetical protein NTY22_05495, partial [Proteobacteria bacterium]|nr:hypothetical protein [Pseudomonadota bacterium]